MQQRINVRGVIFHKGRILAQTIKQTNGESNYWCTPGGGLEPGERVTMGLTREIIEETGIRPAIGRLLFVHQFHDGIQEQLEFFFHIENPYEYEKVDLNTTTHGHIEISRTEFIVPTAHRLLPDFLQILDLEKYIAETLPVVFTSEF